MVKQCLIGILLTGSRMFGNTIVCIQCNNGSPAMLYFRSHTVRMAEPSQVVSHIPRFAHGSERCRRWHTVKQFHKVKSMAKGQGTLGEKSEGVVGTGYRLTRYKGRTPVTPPLTQYSAEHNPSFRHM
jgi:hypothetical protein